MEATSGATATTSTSRGPTPMRATVRRSRPAAIASARSVEPTASPIGVRVRSITSPTSRSRAPASGNSASGVRTRPGISEPANASVPVTLRYDPEPPDLGFEEPSAADPTLISALVTDKVSGLASGQIELSAQGSGVWEIAPHPSGRQPVDAPAIDDAALPARYLRAASHRARPGNEPEQHREPPGRSPDDVDFAAARKDLDVRAGVRRDGAAPRSTATQASRPRPQGTCLVRHRGRVAGVVRTPRWDGRSGMPRFRCSHERQPP